MAENRAAFSFRRRFSLGFSKCRWLRTTRRVPSRSIFFFNRRKAFSTGSPFFNLISVKTSHFLSRLGDGPASRPAVLENQAGRVGLGRAGCQPAKNAKRLARFVETARRRATQGRTVLCDQNEINETSGSCFIEFTLWNRAAAAVSLTWRRASRTLPALCLRQ